MVSDAAQSKSDETPEAAQARRTFQNEYFRYKPLSSRRHEIRLLNLPQRGPEHSLLSSSAASFILSRYMFSSRMQPYNCTMTHVCLDDVPSFHALSYTWGDSTPTCMIVVNDQEFWIPHNLASAIHHLTASEPVTLWIDAICINQKDDTEKTWQVRQMQKVYEGAESVIIWLGQSSVGSRQALSKLAEMHEWKSGNASIRCVTAIQQLYSSFGIHTPLGSTSDPFPLNEVGELFSRSWWSRIWVAQELSSAKEVYFACGYDRIPADAIAFFLEVWDGIVTGTIPRLLDHRPWALFEMREKFQKDRTNKNRLPMKDILQISSKAMLEATDARDYIFGLIGLATDAEDLDVLVDYTKNHEEIFTELAITLLDETDLWILSFCTNVKEDSRLSSWVPDWSRQQGIITILQAGGSANTGVPSPFNAWKGCRSCVSVINQVPPRLAVMGIEIGLIVKVGSLRPSATQNDMTRSKRAEILDWLAVAFKLFDPIEDLTDFSATKHEEALWKIPIADCWQDNSTGIWSRPGDSVEGIYEKLIRKGLLPLDEGEDPQVATDLKKYFAAMMNVTNGRKPFCTRNGYLGLGSQYVELGDIAVILYGCNVPVVLRETGGGRFRLVEEAYIHGVMYGEFTAAKPDGWESRLFELI